MANKEISATSNELYALIAQYLEESIEQTAEPQKEREVKGWQGIIEGAKDGR